MLLGRNICVNRQINIYLNGQKKIVKWNWQKKRWILVGSKHVISWNKYIWRRKISNTKGKSAVPVFVNIDDKSSANPPVATSSIATFSHAPYTHTNICHGVGGNHYQICVEVFLKRERWWLCVKRQHLLLMTGAPHLMDHVIGQFICTQLIWPTIFWHRNYLAWLKASQNIKFSFNLKIIYWLWSI